MGQLRPLNLTVATPVVVSTFISIILLQFVGKSGYENVWKDSEKMKEWMEVLTDILLNGIGVPEEG
jgi:hypothetical protein